MAWDSDYDWKDWKIKLMMFWFTSCLILITNWESERSWDSTFLLVSTVHVLVKCKLSFCFSTSAEEYEAKMPQYFLYEQQVVHQSSMIPMYYMWAPITVHRLCNMCRSVEDWILIIVKEFELSVTSDTWLYWFCFGFISYLYFGFFLFFYNFWSESALPLTQWAKL